jgi:protein O-mannosyl-transferase
MRTHLTVALALGFVVGLSYSSAFRAAEFPGGFALDNKFIILEDPRLRSATKENVRLIFTQDYWWPKGIAGLYRPVTTLSYLFNYAVLGNKDHAIGYVIISVLLHWANAVLVYFLALILLKNYWPAAFAAALFAAHPLGTEAVTNIVGRADEFAALSVLGGLLLYAKSATVTGWRKVPWLGGMMLTTAIGIFCKESAVVVVGAVAAYDFVYRLQRKRPMWLSNLVSNFWGFFCTGYVWFIPPLIGLWLVRAHVFANLPPPELPFVDNPLADAGFLTSRVTAIKVIGYHLSLLIWPWSSSCDYSYNQIPLMSWTFHTWEDWKAVLALLAVIAIIVIAVRQLRRNKAVCFFILFGFLCFLPASNLIFVCGTIMAERLMYLPMIGFAGCAVVAIYSVARRLAPQLRGKHGTGFHSSFTSQTVVMLALPTVCVLVFLYGARTFVRNFDWRDDITLWTSAIRVCPDSFKTHKSLAYALYEKDGPEYKNIDRIIREAEEAVRITDTAPINDRASIVYLHLGTYYRIKGDKLLQRVGAGTFAISGQSAQYYRKAVETLLRAVDLDHQFNNIQREKDLRRGRRPDQIHDVGNHEIYFHLGLTYQRLSQYDNALQAFLYMRHLVPNNPDAYLNISRAHLAMGQKEAAAIALLQTCLLDNSRKDVWSQLFELYRDLDRDNCAVVVVDGKSQLNLGCPIVRRHICTAYLDLARVFVETKQEALARQIKEVATKNYHCTPEEFNRLLP